MPMLSWAWLRCTPVAMEGSRARGLRSFACASAVWACKGLARGMFSGARFGRGLFTGLRAAPSVKGVRWAWGLSGVGAGAGVGARQLGQRAEQAVGAWRRVAKGLGARCGLDRGRLRRQWRTGATGSV